MLQLFIMSLAFSAPRFTKAGRVKAQKENVASLTIHVYARHRQTPCVKHEMKTRHADCSTQRISHIQLST